MLIIDAEFTEIKSFDEQLAEEINQVNEQLEAFKASEENESFVCKIMKAVFSNRLFNFFGKNSFEGMLEP